MTDSKSNLMGWALVDLECRQTESGQWEPVAVVLSHTNGQARRLTKVMKCPYVEPCKHHGATIERGVITCHDCNKVTDLNKCPECNGPRSECPVVCGIPF